METDIKKDRPLHFQNGSVGPGHERFKLRPS